MRMPAASPPPDRSSAPPESPASPTAVSQTSRSRGGRTRINQTIQVGDCELEEGQEPCCTAVYRWLFAEGFAVNALGFDVEAAVRGVITVELKVWKVGG